MLTWSLTASRRWLIPCTTLALLAAAPIANAQIADPLPNIPVGGVQVEVEFVVALPDSGSVSKPTARPMTLVGDGGGRRFVADQNGFVYQIHPDDSLSLFLDVAAATSLLADMLKHVQMLILAARSSLAARPQVDNCVANVRLLVSGATAAKQVASRLERNNPAS
jgi:hypothetical protein